MKLAVLYSLVLSILHSILFYGQKWGISIFLFVVTGMFFVIDLLNKNEKVKNKKALLLSIPIALLSATYFIFNNSFFNFFNVIVILLLYALMVIMAVNKEFKINKLFANIFTIFFGPAEEIGKSTELIFGTLGKEKHEKDENAKKYLIKKILKAILISAPLLIVVIILLMTADESFAQIFKGAFDSIFKLLNLKSIYSLIFRVLIIIALTIYFMGMIIKITKKDLENNEANETCEKKKIDKITLNTLLTLLNIIYLIFTLIQGVNLIEHMEMVNGIDYAHYARTGFFQLMVVSLINFVVILICKYNVKNVENKNYTKIMNILLAVFTIVLLITSVVRMNLYAEEYGYTFLRLIVYFIQITELILIIPTIIYIIKKKFDIFKYYLIITIFMYIVVNFANLDYIIAKENIDRYLNNIDKEIDLIYLEKNLSTDAIPQITRLLDCKDENVKRNINNFLVTKYNDLQEEGMNPQEFNLSKYRAKEILKKQDIQFYNYIY